MNFGSLIYGRSNRGFFDRANLRGAARCFSHITILVALTLLAFAQTTPSKAKPKKSGTESAIEGELLTRLAGLEQAKRSGDPLRVAESARLVIASAVRQSAEIQLGEKMPADAVESLKSSLSFEDAFATRSELAVAYLAANRLDEALATATDLLTADPQNAYAWYLQGRVLMRKQGYLPAVEAFRHARNLQPKPDWFYWLGVALLETHQLEAAKVAFQTFLAQSGDKSLMHGRLSEAYREAQYPNEAVREMKIAAELNPNISASSIRQKSASADLITLQGDIQTKDFVATSATSDLRQRQQTLRNIAANALNDLGTAEARQEQFSLALAHFEQAEQWDPTVPGLQRNLGIAAMRASNYAEAARALRTVVAAYPEDSVARATLGSALFTLNDFPDAVRAFTPLGDAALEHPEVAYAWAASLVKINKYAEAAMLLGKLEVRQISPQMMLLIAQIWSQMGTYTRTVDICHRALQVDPHLLNAHYLAGVALIRQSRAMEATQEFREELKLDPDNTEAQYNLAFALLQQSQDEEAVRWLKKVVESNPDHPHANYELGKQMLSSGDAVGSIPYLEAAARLQPGFEPVHYQLQKAYRATGRTDDADREAKVYRELKSKSRNIKLPPPPEEHAATSAPN